MQHNPAAGSPSTAVLSTVFSELARVRIPRTSTLVYKARAAGELRVVAGAEACATRDETVREMWAGKTRVRGDVDAVRTLYADLFSFPFEAGKSEI